MKGGHKHGRKGQHHKGGKKGHIRPSGALLEHQAHLKVLTPIEDVQARVVTAHLHGYHLNGYTQRWLDESLEKSPFGKVMAAVKGMVAK